jgi:hypothetical protein
MNSRGGALQALDPGLTTARTRGLEPMANTDLAKHEANRLRLLAERDRFFEARRSDCKDWSPAIRD